MKKKQIQERLDGRSFLIKSLTFNFITRRSGEQILPELNQTQIKTYLRWGSQFITVHLFYFFFYFNLEVRKKSVQEVISRLVLCYNNYHRDHSLHCCHHGFQSKKTCFDYFLFLYPLKKNPKILTYGWHVSAATEMSNISLKH